MRQDLVNMLVHDLRGPLGNLINTIELVMMIARKDETNADLVRFLEMGKRTGRTLTDLVDSMLDVSRLEQGEVPLQCSMTRLEQLLTEVLEQVEPQAESKDTTLIFQPIPAGAQPEVWLDNSLMRRVLTNLVSNAIKYAPEEAQVELITSIEAEMLQFAVKDNGDGISKKDQRRIFDKFSRISYSADGPSGVGLGLAFCKLAIEAHKGQISVESTGLAGEGSIFYVRIPLITEPDD
jgi:signal transduction histidine kinase